MTEERGQSAFRDGLAQESVIPHLSSVIASTASASAVSFSYAKLLACAEAGGSAVSASSVDCHSSSVIAREASPSPGAPPDEAALQALWQSNRYRPKSLALPSGEAVEVIAPGRHTGGPGPDFQDALVSIGGLLRRGDVELHLHPADWDQHGHAGDSAYANLILHVTWFEGPAAKHLPPGVPTLALRPFMPQAAGFDFSCLPRQRYAEPDGERPCRRALADNPGAVDALLLQAGRFRLQNKARILADALRIEPPQEVLYAGLMRAMGYGRNAETFCRLAREVPLRRLQPFPALQRFAILAGHAGLLPQSNRALWDLWWQSSLQPPLKPYAWDLRAMRPQNHPFRRLAGLVGLLDALERLAELPPKALPDALCQAAALLCEPLALAQCPIGRARANAIVTNLFVPYRLALGRLSLERLPDLPGESVSMPMREAWFHLTGSLEHLPSEGLRQQALLQLYADFCNNPKVRCATCPVAAVSR